MSDKAGDVSGERIPHQLDAGEEHADVDQPVEQDLIDAPRQPDAEPDAEPAATSPAASDEPGGA